MWHDADLTHPICVRHERSHQGMTRFMISNRQTLPFVHHHCPALKARDQALEGRLEVLYLHCVGIAPRCQQRCFVHQVLEIGTTESRCDASGTLQIEVLRQLQTAAVDLQDLQPPCQVRLRHSDLTVKSPCTRKRWVEHFGAVCCGDDYHRPLWVGSEAIDLGQQLVQGLLSLIYSARVHTAWAAAALTDRVDLVDEHDRRCSFTRLLEQGAHARRSHA